MTNLWPNQLTIKFIERGSLKPAGPLLVAVNLHCARKNDIPLGWFYCKSDGTLFVVREQIEHAVNEAVSMFPMDYAPSAGECVGLRVTTKSKQRLKEFATRMAQLYPRDSTLILSRLADCQNDGYSEVDTSLLLNGQEYIVKVDPI